MQKYILFLPLLIVSLMSAQVSANPHQPTLREIVVLYDGMEKEWSSRLFHYVAYADVILDITMDSNCPRVAIKAGNVYCVTPSTFVKVGSLSNSKYSQGWGIFSVEWQNNVELVARKTSVGHAFSIRLK